MNQNFVIAIDMGKAFNEQDGNIGVFDRIELSVLEIIVKRYCQGNTMACPYGLFLIKISFQEICKGNSEVIA